MTSFATRSPTRITGLTTRRATLPPVHRHNYGGTFGGPIRKNKTFFFFDWDGTRSSDIIAPQAGVPSAAERTGHFGELCGARAARSMRRALRRLTGALVQQASFGIPIPAHATPLQWRTGAYRSAFIPFNSLATYTSPGNPNLNGNPYQLTQVHGNLIDSVALKMMSFFPMPNYSAAALMTTGSLQVPTQFERPVRPEDRSPLQREESAQRQVLARP